MRQALLTAALLVSITPVFAGSSPRITGDYVEARTAEVFAGGCIMASEAETMGRQAVLAWRIGAGAYNGVQLTGLAVVAAVAADRNLGIREIGGGAPENVKAVVFVDSRATAAQQQALVALVRAMSRGLADNIIEVKPTAIAFDRSAHMVNVRAHEATLVVHTHIEHSPRCGAMKWFNPLADGTTAEIGHTETQVYWGKALGSKWRQEDRKSSFVGSFAF